MTKTLKISVATTAFVVATILVYAGITAYAASSLFGDAEIVLGGNPGTAVQIRSDDAPGWGGIYFDDMNGELFSSLGGLSTDFNVTDDNCGGGGPRFTVTVTNGVITKNIFVYLGDHPGYDSCTANTWVSSGNLLDGAANHTLDTSQLPGGTFYDTYANAVATYGAYTIQGISVETDSGWSAVASGGDGEQTVLIDNVKISKLINFSYDFEVPPPPAEVTVTIVKYVDGVHATAGNANSLSFPINATWDATNIGAGSGSFALSTAGFNNPNPYEATTAAMTSGADYSVSEDVTGSNVGASCADGKPFALGGYSTGSTEVAAVAAATSSSAALTNITSDTFVIVWNKKCGATLIVKKVIVNDNGGSSATTTFSFKVNGGASQPFEADGENVLTLPAGNHSVVEDVAAGYTTTYANTATANADCNNLPLSDGDVKTCTITNNDDPVVTPPPPANACNTPAVAPAGYTLVNGTTGSDNVTIAPFTMFVGLGGYDTVNGPADGNYIVCTGLKTDKITLGNGDFTISAGDGYNVIVTGNGNGYITAGIDGDNITTGDGVQTIQAGNGYNKILTGNGDKNITAGIKGDQITTGSGNDVINAGIGYNNIKSGAGNDSITTGVDNDTIDGGADTDTCSAGGGYDSVVNCEA